MPATALNLTTEPIETVIDYCEEISRLSNATQAMYCLSSPVFAKKLSSLAKAVSDGLGDSINALLGENKLKVLHSALTYIYLADDENMDAIRVLNTIYNGNLEQGVLLTKFH